MELIQLVNYDESTLVSDEDYIRLSCFRWFMAKGYAVRYANGQTIYMHHEIIGYPTSGYHVDHIDRITLNNLRENLRIVTRGQNSQNTIARSPSGFKGVHKTSKKRWKVHITYNGVKLNLGSFKDKVLAAKIYDQAAKYFYGEHARLNFPNKTNLP